jgi:hypothetical protein
VVETVLLTRLTNVVVLEATAVSVLRRVDAVASVATPTVDADTVFDTLFVIVATIPDTVADVVIRTFFTKVGAPVTVVETIF